MAFQAVPDVAEIVFVYIQNGETMVNTLHALRAGGYNQGQIINLAAAMDSAIAATPIAEMVDELTYLRTEVRGLTLINDFAATNSDSSELGDLVGPGLPNNVTLSIKRASNVTGRSARGRWFWCGLALSDLASGENFVDGVRANAKRDALDTLRVAITNEGWSPVVVSRFTEGAARDEGVTFPWVTTVLVNAAVDSQRGRLSN